MWEAKNVTYVAGPWIGPGIAIRLRSSTDACDFPTLETAWFPMQMEVPSPTHRSFRVSLIVTVAAIACLVAIAPDVRRILAVRTIPFAHLLGFIGCFLLWTGARSVRYYLLLRRPPRSGARLLAITWAHHAAVHAIPLHAGVLAYPVLVRRYIGSRWRHIWISMIGSTLGDGLAMGVLLFAVTEGTLRWALLATIGSVLVVLTAVPGWAQKWFRRRHQLPRRWFRTVWWSLKALTLGGPYWWRRNGLVWMGLSLCIIAAKYAGLGLLYTGWADVLHAPRMPIAQTVVAFFIAEISRELPVSAWLHLGTWEIAWTLAAGTRSAIPAVVWTHLSYEVVVLFWAGLGLLGVNIPIQDVRPMYRRHAENP